MSGRFGWMQHSLTVEEPLIIRESHATISEVEIRAAQRGPWRNFEIQDQEEPIDWEPLRRNVREYGYDASRFPANLPPDLVIFIFNTIN
jgi:hypothetical protein